MVLVSKIVSCLVGTRLISCSRVLALSLVGGGDNDAGLTPFTEEVVFGRAICKRILSSNCSRCKRSVRALIVLSPALAAEMKDPRLTRSC